MIIRACELRYPADESIVLNRVDTFKIEDSPRKDDSPDSAFIRGEEGEGAVLIRASSGNYKYAYSFSMFDPDYADTRKMLAAFGGYWYLVTNINLLIDTVENKLNNLEVEHYIIITDYVIHDTPEDLKLSFKDGQVKFQSNKESLMKEIFFRKPVKDIWQGEFRIVVRTDHKFDEDRIMINNSDCDLTKVFSRVHYREEGDKGIIYKKL